MTRTYIGLDVHKASISISLALAGKQEPIFYGKAPGNIEGTERALHKIKKKYQLEKKDIQHCYEAGPCRFVLARRLLHLGYDLIITPPSMIPSASGDKVKTDRRDSLTGIFTP